MTYDTLHQHAPDGGDTPKRRSGWLAVAIGLHLVAALVYGVWPEALPLPTTPPATAPASVSLAEHREAVQASRRARAKLARKTAAPIIVRAKPKPKPLDGQIVEVARSPDDRAPKDAAYLAEHNASTEHETRSRHVPKQSPRHILPETSKQAEETQPQSPGAPAVDLATPLTGPKTDKPSEDSAKPASPEAAHPKPKAERQAQDRLALRRQDVSDGLRNRERVQASKGEPAGHEAASPSAGPRAAPTPQAGLTMADLIPSVGVLARLSGGPSNDALQDLDEGEGTFLNAREFKYASYFMRIKRSVAQEWRAAEEYQRRDPTGNIYGYKSRTTGVSVTLDQAGSLKVVRLAESSGVDFLDREGVRAFQAAAPFPNPPKALLDDADEIKFQFSFVFSIGRQGFLAAPY